MKVVVPIVVGVILLLTVFMVLQESQKASNVVVTSNNLPEQEQINETEILRKDPAVSVAAQEEVVQTHTIGDVIVTLPSGWETKNSLYVTDDYNGVQVVSPDYSTTTVVAGMGGNETETINTGAQLGYASEPENVSERLEDAAAYAEFQKNIATNSTNNIESKTIYIAGIPAFYGHYDGRDGEVGGFVTVEFYRDGQIYRLGMKYGLQSEYETYRDAFMSVIESVEIK